MQTLLHHGCAFRAWVSISLALGLHAFGQFIATGVDEGAPPSVKVFRGTNPAESLSFFAYGPNFMGGVRVAVGDVNGDAQPDVITAPGAGAPPQVKAFNGSSGAEFKSFLAYDPAFTGGVFVAVGDVNGDGIADIVTGTGEGSVPQVKVFNGLDNAVLRSFFPYDPGFAGGVRVAVGDVNGDGIGDIITGTASGTSHVKVFSGQTLGELASFFAYSPTFQGGVFVAAGDVNGDGRADIITGAGAGAGPHVRVFSGATLTEINSFFAYAPTFTGGVRVAAGDINGDGREDVITAPGSGAGPQVKAFDSRSGSEFRSFLAYASNFTGGVFVGSRPPGVSSVSATTGAATNVSFTTATLNGTVNANGENATARFEYGQGANLLSTLSAKPSEVTGRLVTPVTANISGLIPGTVYSFRVVAIDELGDRTNSLIVTFTTTINNPAKGGTFSISPDAPVPAGTTLTATFNGWTDEDGHNPLTYEVREGTTVIVPAGIDPAPTFTLPPGTHRVHGRIYDSLGAFAETVAMDVVVVGDPESTLAYTTGDVVPGAGSGGVPVDAKWTRFGVPAIDDQGTVAFAGKWASPTGKGGGIFHSGRMLAVTGGLVPNTGTGSAFAIPEGAVFKSFKDPVIDSGGLIAFIATIAGKGVAVANDTVIVSNSRTGALEVIAREGSPAPGTNGAKFRFFNGISNRIAQGQNAGGQPQQTGGTIFTARLAGVQTRQNMGAWWLPPGAASTMLLVRKGGEGFAPGETIKNFILLQSLSGSPGHGRGQIDANKALLQVSLSSGKQAQVLATPGALESIVQTGDTFDQESSVWIRMSQPSSGNVGQNLSVLGTFQPVSNSANSHPGRGILRSLDGGATWSVLAGVGQTAGGADSIWIDLSYPVNSRTSAGVAFHGKVKEATQPPYTSIWWAPENEDLKLVARQGSQAAECASGEKWLAFKSVALPGGATGPLFIAKMRSLRDGAPRGKVDTGAWGVDRAGSLRLLVREGTTSIGGKTVRSFNLLKEVDGSPGVTRAFNSHGQVVWQATFDDRTTGIVLTRVP